VRKSQDLCCLGEDWQAKNCVTSGSTWETKRNNIRHEKSMQDLRFSQRWLWRMSSSGMWRGVALVNRTDVPPKRRFDSQELHGATSQKTVFFSRRVTSKLFSPVRLWSLQVHICLTVYFTSVASHVLLFIPSFLGIVNTEEKFLMFLKLPVCRSADPSVSCTTTFNLIENVPLNLAWLKLYSRCTHHYYYYFYN
jgi:hypothetical protein